ncbi:MAG: protein O-mannosyl-transferase [Blastocatellia bacterium]
MKASSTVVRSKKRTAVGKARAGDRPGAHATRRQLYIAVAVLAVVVFACFANSLGNDFVFDDKAVILDNRLLRSLANLPRLLTSSYRPLRDMSHALDFALWGENPAGFHLTNILIHLANSVLVFTLIRRLAGDFQVALIAALVFAVHPIQTDAVTYISGRRDILFSLFYLASFHCYLSYKASNSRRYFVLFIGCWALSLMAKEMAVSLPAFIFIWNFCDAWGEQTGGWLRRLWGALRAAFRRDRWLYVALMAAVLAYAWYMIFIKRGSVLARDGFKYWGGSFYTNLLLILRVQAWDLKQLVWPTPIVQYKGAFDVTTTALDWRVLVSLATVAATLAGGLLALNRYRLMAFAVLSYFVMLLPVSQIIPHHELLADHYLYLPILSFGLLVGLIIQQLAARGSQARKIAYAATATALVAMALMTVLRNRVWKDDLSLWQANYQEVPNSIRSASSLAKAYASNNPGRSEELYKRCVEIDPAYWQAYYSLALLGRSREKAHEVEALIRNGLTLSDAQIAASGVQEPSLWRSQMTGALALTKFNQGDADSAEQLCREAIRINPLNPQPYTLLANYYREREPARAIATLEQLVAAYPGHREPLEQVAALLIEDQRYDEAIGYLEQLLNLAPNDYAANRQLSRAYRGKSDCGRARVYLTAARAVALSVKEQREIQGDTDELNKECNGR